MSKLKSEGLSSPTPWLTNGRDALAELGWVEGKNFIYEWRDAPVGESHRLPELAARLVARNPDVISTNTTSGLRALRDATQTIPLVTYFQDDPVALGFVESLARPGGNITGMLGFYLHPKQLELLKEAVPHVSRVGVVYDTTWFWSSGYREIEPAAQNLGIQLIQVDVRDTATRTANLQSLLARGVDALHVVNVNHIEIRDFALRNRLPTISTSTRQAEESWLMAYGPDTSQPNRAGARYVDRILRGARPVDLPVEQPTHLLLVINLVAARAIGVTVPQSLLLRADKVIA